MAIPKHGSKQHYCQGTVAVAESKQTKCPILASWGFAAVAFNHYFTPLFAAKTTNRALEDKKTRLSTLSPLPLSHQPLPPQSGLVQCLPGREKSDVLRSSILRMRRSIKTTAMLIWVPTPPPLSHGASHLVHAMSAWSLKTRRASSRHRKNAKIYGNTTTAMHDKRPPLRPPDLTSACLSAAMELATLSLAAKLAFFSCAPSSRTTEQEWLRSAVSSFTALLFNAMSSIA